jgi:cell division protein FtsB
VKKKGGGVSRAPLYAGAIALALVLFFYFFLMPLLAKKKAFRARMAELKGELDAEQETHGKLQRERKLLERNDPAFLEKYARDNFGWAREGEIVYKLEKPK